MTAKADLRPGASLWVMYLECDDCGARTNKEPGPYKWDGYTLKRLAVDATRCGWWIKDDDRVSSWCPRCMAKRANIAFSDRIKREVK